MPTIPELQRWMKRKDLTTGSAAAYLHVNVRTVQRWLVGERKIPNWLATVMGEGK